MAIQFPDDFRCPISLEIMSDPVIISSGHTFDRVSIQRWLDAGHRTCPITKLPLPDHPLLIPNHALRSLISNFTLLSTPNSPNCPSPQTLISALTSAASPLSAKLNSLHQLTKLTKLNPSLRRELTESGAAAAVLRCVNSPDSAVQQEALSLLLNLSLDDDDKVGLVAEGVISRVVEAIRVGSPGSRAIGCTILTSLAVVEVNKATIGAYPNAIEVLITILTRGNGREVREAATALYAICLFPDNRVRAVKCGAVGILVNLGGMGLERAVEVLSVLVKCKEGKEEMVRIGKCLEVLVRVAQGGSEKGVQCALFTMNCLCGYSEKMCEDAVRIGVLDICLGLVQDENEKIRRNASGLVRTLSGGGSVE